MPVYGGLADSKNVLQGIGLARIRLGNVRTLGPLSDAEVRSYLEQMLDSCRISVSRPGLDRLADGIAERSEGWPQHVHTETAALFWDSPGPDAIFPR